jgi:hypothetical protein
MPMNCGLALKRDTSSMAATLATVNRGEPADTGHSGPWARIRELCVGICTFRVIATAVPNVPYHAVAVRSTGKMFWDVDLIGALLIARLVAGVCHAHAPSPFDGSISV